MFETREFRGWWWLPAQTENQLPGTLVVTRGEAELDLTGHFGHAVLAETDHEMVMSGHLAEQPRILGIDRNGKEVTSDGHQSASYSEHSAGVTISKYTRRITLVGKHFQAGEEIEFDEIAIRASDLTAWTQTRVIETKAKTRKRKRGHVWGDVSARSKTLPDIEITLARGERAFIRFGAKFKGLDIWGRGSEHAELTQDTAFHLRFGRARDLDYIFDRVGDLRNFLSLAVGRPVAILEVTGYRDDSADERTKLPIPSRSSGAFRTTQIPPKSRETLTRCSLRFRPFKPRSRRCCEVGSPNRSGWNRVGFENSVMRGSGGHAAALYSLMRPPRTSRLWMVIAGARTSTAGGWFGG